MKRMLSIVAGALVLGSLSYGQTTNVYSQNAVGYVKITLPADGQFVLVRNDFMTLDGSPSTIASIIGEQVEGGTTVFKWDRANSQYVLPAATLVDFLGTKTWNNDQPVERGDALFIQNAAGAAEAEIYLLGEVPGANNGAETTLVADSFGFVGYPYPSAVNWEESEIANQAPVGSTLFQWDPATQGYVVPGPSKIDFLGTISWSGSPTIQPGEAFFLDTQGGTPSATETKQYPWP